MDRLSVFSRKVLALHHPYRRHGSLFTGTSSSHADALWTNSVQLWELAALSIHRSSLHKYGKSHRLAGADQESQPWALITGASDGLGVGWAQELAAEGINVILHGRNPTKLDALKRTLEAEHKISVRTLVLDAEKLPTSTEEGAYKEFDQLILDTVTGIPLTILINVSTLLRSS